MSSYSEPTSSPGPSAEFIGLARKYELPVYPKRDVVFVRGSGAKLWDADGREYIDCAAGVGVASLGHGNEQVAEAIAHQARLLVTCGGTFDNDVRSRLLERLVGIAPPGLTRAFLCNSGTEAIEAAIKFARLTTKRTDFVCANRSFHGRTLGALSGTHNPEYREDFEPLVPGFSFVPFNTFGRLESAVTEHTAAVILEIVQGEGGVNVGSGDYFRAVRELCRRQGALLIVDEVQTGFCRTGKLFACMHHDVIPDLMCLAKAIAGGLPMGAVLCSDKIAPAILKHGSTFGGNPLCCAAALAALDYMIAQRLDQQAAEKGEYFLAALRGRPMTKVREIRGVGLMIGLELKQKVKPVLVELLKRGIVALPAGSTVLRLLPPLVISHDDLDTVAGNLADLLR